MNLKTVPPTGLFLAGSPVTAAERTARFQVPATVAPEAAKALAVVHAESSRRRPLLPVTSARLPVSEGP